MKIKQTKEHNKSEKQSKSEKAINGWGTRSVYGGKGLDRFWAESEKEQELRRVEMMMMYHVH